MNILGADGEFRYFKGAWTRGKSLKRLKTSATLAV